MGVETKEEREIQDTEELIERLDNVVRDFVGDPDYQYMRSSLILKALHQFSKNWTLEGICQNRRRG